MSPLSSILSMASLTQGKTPKSLQWSKRHYMICHLGTSPTHVLPPIQSISSTLTCVLLLSLNKPGMLLTQAFVHVFILCLDILPPLSLWITPFSASNLCSNVFDNHLCKLFPLAFIFSHSIYHHLIFVCPHIQVLIGNFNEGRKFCFVLC